MKAFFVIFIAAIGLGFAAFGAYYSWSAPREGSQSVAQVDELEWLRREFNLSEAQLKQVQEVHAKYLPVCELLCEQVIEAQGGLERALLEATEFTTEVDVALARFSRIKEDCHRSMLQHVYEVAAVMEPGQRQLYLERAKAQVTMHDRVHP